MDRMNNNIKFWLTILIGIIVGMIIGSLSVTTFVSYKMDKYYEKINTLYTMVEDRDVKLKKLEESINKSKYVLKDVIIELKNVEDDIEKLKLKKYIKEKYINLIGKEIKKIDVNIVSEIIDGRIMKLKDVEYKLKVNKVLLSDILVLEIEVKEIYTY